MSQLIDGYSREFIAGRLRNAHERAAHLRRQADKEYDQRDRDLRMLHNAGVSDDEIIELTGLSALHIFAATSPALIKAREQAAIDAERVKQDAP